MVWVNELKLTSSQQEMLDGNKGKAKRKAMELLVALGKIYGATEMVAVASVQVAGVSYKNLGEAGLEFLSETAVDGKVEVLTTLNPAGIDVENWEALGYPEEFAKKQTRVLDAFEKMGIQVSCTCTPYLIGNLPSQGSHVAWSESSAVIFANSVLGLKTNREGGPSALASALTGFTPNYGLHLDENRQARVKIDLCGLVKSEADWAVLGKVLGEKIGNKIPYLVNHNSPDRDKLKIFGASIATYGGTAMFYADGITPGKTNIPEETLIINKEELQLGYSDLTDADEVDFIGVGCPHASLEELKQVAGFLDGKKVKIPVWIFTARKTKEKAEEAGYAKTILDAGAQIVCDTCMAVSPLKGRFKCLGTDSAKACYYGRGTNDFKTKIGTLEQCINAGVTGKW
jgi:predicted aconitase